MKLILREDVPYLGGAGDVVRVRPGYGRNYLLPRGLAYMATARNLRRVEEEARLQGERRRRDYLEASRQAAVLESLTLTFARRAGEEGQLFGSVTAREICDEVGRTHGGFALDRRTLELDGPIKTVGEHELRVRLHADVEAKLRVVVEIEEG